MKMLRVVPVTRLCRIYAMKLYLKSWNEEIGVREFSGGNGLPIWVIEEVILQDLHLVESKPKKQLKSGLKNYKIKSLIIHQALYLFSYLLKNNFPGQYFSFRY